ncbi:MAG: ester cyclase [Acidimicrobiales bacterium]
MTQRTARLRGWRGSSSTGGAWESHSRTSSFDVDLLLADDDHITLVYRLSGTHKGEFMGHASTGKHFEVRSGRSIRERPDCPALAGPPTSSGLT